MAHNLEFSKDRHLIEQSGEKTKTLENQGKSEKRGLLNGGGKYPSEWGASLQNSMKLATPLSGSAKHGVHKHGIQNQWKRQY